MFDRGPTFLLALILPLVVPLTPSSALADGPAPAPAPSVAGHWEKLGERTVTGKDGKDGDNETVVVDRDDAVFRAVQFRVDSRFGIRAMKVVFSNGETFEPPIRWTWEKKSPPHEINLPGDKRVIKRIDFTFTTSPIRGGSARVEVWGSDTKVDRPRR